MGCDVATACVMYLYVVSKKVMWLRGWFRFVGCCVSKWEFAAATVSGGMVGV
jgi:hypothetical protein